ncbi:TonB-dependent receptor [Capnocytophaga sputigena]|uniref:Colicin I receptor n=1 Tax=Capnocytophaga sputigena TaxID=1019 RepID=A0AAX2IDY0_CAPSP|nr:TonB-dependent receptor [Capnocytophaga sputigena]ATA85037.1 energy transducer TonB [Capnocytophaga sputigena]EEB64840.1 TonB-dependent receptor plug domain protein [Capnocytophaga sputigena ATCC 33612]SQA76346.1 Colicin I receptor precursor [Capnocytophaga sputigena]
MFLSPKNITFLLASFFASQLFSQPVDEEVTQLSEVVLTGQSPIKQVQKAAYNVVAIEAQQLRNLNSNAADMLARVSGVKMRETGGVGAEANINLNGFTGRHVRIFIDGVPMNEANASFRINNIPAELIERIEIYKGVVPVTFGADALGGAINVVTRKSRYNYGNLSYTFGSFNTHKSTLNLGQFLTDNISVELNAYQNYSDNSYKVFTEYLDLQTGTYSKEKRWFKRFHDRYHNEAIIGRVNIFDEKWADKLSFALNYSQEDKQLQNANLMQKVFGGKYRKSHNYSSSVEYEKKNILNGLSFFLTGRYDFTTTQNVDEEARRYSWTGEYEPMVTRGESQLQNTIFEGKTGYITSHLDYQLNEKHSFQLTHTFSNYTRRNKNMLITNYTLDSDFMRRVNEKNISGFSYKFTPSERWNILAFGKYYNTAVTGPVIISGQGSRAVYEEETHHTQAWGYGGATTYQLLKPLQVKLSYEKSFRLPTDTELFGDGDLEIGNYKLKPENSDNLNVNLSYQPAFKAHSLLVEAGFAYRYIKDYIIRSIISAGANEGSAGSRNHGKVLNMGVDATLRYFYKDVFSVGGNLSYMNLRNKEEFTETGRPSAIYNDRLPNMPYLFGNADATCNIGSLIAKHDKLSLNYNLFFTEEFFTSWQSEGTKIKVPRQLSHDVSLTYYTPNKRLSLSVEAKNITDELLYDNYSLQKAGRAFYAKLSYRFY